MVNAVAGEGIESSDLCALESRMAWPLGAPGHLCRTKDSYLSDHFCQLPDMLMSLAVFILFFPPRLGHV